MRELSTLKRTYSSGFEAQVVMRPQFAKQFIGIIVDFGGADPQKVAGGAHFLEHMLFNKPDGDIAHRFEEVGATTNAFTSENETMFYAEMTNHWRKVVPLLFELVGTTSFSEKGIAKEAHIIDQELSMYQDDILWQARHNLLQMMFPNSNLSTDLAGTHESIAAMSAKDLEEIYHAHYLANNMKFIACGGFSQNQAQEILREVGKLENKYISAKKYQLPTNQVSPSEDNHDMVITGDVDTSRVIVGIKLPDFEEFDPSKNLMQSIIESMLEEKLGTMSSWFKKAQQNALLVSPLDISVSYTRQGNFATIAGFAPNYQKLILAIKAQIKNFNGDKRLFTLQKKEYIAEMIRERDNISDLAIEAGEMMLEREDLDTVVRRFQNLSFSEFCDYYKKIISKSDIFTSTLASNSSNLDSSNDSLLNRGNDTREDNGDETK
ncbi:putative Zn-dependent peptidase [Lactobacillus colini]|uniref:Zn-dependent peptidase n=1 Tax=Lactobacillus colini TaxID=1819254 RepID=A0ABS4MDA1_9LACO|nr:pitrilysin family protein [Lactobacillus colini]MBP2057644.1 putative Zn-dependent peptidase [Lactobacillus colini]